MSRWVVLKSLEKDCQTKFFFIFIVRWQVKNSDKKYEHALKIWDRCQMNMMKDYRDLYLKCDALFLADELKKFRNRSLMNYGFCYTHSLNAPALTWDAVFNMAKVELKRILHADTYLLFEKCMRGRVSYISKRYSKSNHKNLKSYDQKQESKQILYLDANNLDPNG